MFQLVVPLLNGITQTVASQKFRGSRGKISDERILRLKEIGITINVKPKREYVTLDLENKFQLLSKFKEREGHCKVPFTHLEEGYTLGKLVSRLRNQKEKLSPDQKKRLDDLNFVWSVTKSNKS